jgi:23S rRNA A2030 N6-methylase RlmJ
LELTVGAPSIPGRLHRCGLIVINPHWTLESELSVLLPTIAHSLSLGRAEAFRLDWLGAER